MQTQYNRVILIGNGFDLAMGLKTSYSDFILDFLKENIIKFAKDEPYHSELFEIKKKSDYILNDDTFFTKVNNTKTVKELYDYIEYCIKIVECHKFFEKILKQNKETTWVDIEQYYYKTLISYFDDEFRLANWDGMHERVIGLNKCMDELKIALNKYIRKIQDNSHIDYPESNLYQLFDEKFILPLDSKKLKHIRKYHRKTAPSNVIFLNFNYTDTVKDFIRNSYWGKTKPYHISIHGSAINDDYPIIFGYGDDNSDKYKQLEIEDNNEWLRMIKSFQYGRDSNYHNFLNYINSLPFDVFIVGHSCGMSDKTLLKTIFEHDNCIAIQNYCYKGQEEHFYKTMQISRHFDDKAKMRERVLPFDKWAEIPQDKIL